MGSVSASGFSVANLLDSLTGTGSLAAALSTPSVQTALQNAPAGDTVELSDEALQLQETSLLFGNSNTGTPAIPAALNPLSTLLSSLESTDPALAASGDGASSTTTTPTASLANQLGGYQSDMQSQEMQTLFGMTSTAPQLSSLFDQLG